MNSERIILDKITSLLNSQGFKYFKIDRANVNYVNSNLNNVKVLIYRNDFDIITVLLDVKLNSVLESEIKNIINSIDNQIIFLRKVIKFDIINVYKIYNNDNNFYFNVILEDYELNEGFKYLTKGKNLKIYM